MAWAMTWTPCLRITLRNGRHRRALRSSPNEASPTRFAVSTSGAPRCVVSWTGESSMNSNPIEFHKIWIDQCAATEGIRERFGREDALNYLIGEKLFSFLHAAERDPLFAAETFRCEGTQPTGAEAAAARARAGSETPPRRPPSTASD